MKIIYLITVFCKKHQFMFKCLLFAKKCLDKMIILSVCNSCSLILYGGIFRLVSSPYP